MTADGLHAASATRDITPEAPQQLSGFGPGSLKRVSTGVHSPLNATALVIDDGETRVALASLDLLNVTREFTSTVRERVADFGFDAMTLVATHTHSAPYVPGELLEINPLLSYTADTSAYVDETIDATVDAIQEATERLEPATLRVGRAENEDVLWNRRGDGPVDPELLALLVVGETGAETVLFNYACHPTVTRPLSTLVSADWVATTYETVRAETDATVLFVNGATGDVNAAESRSHRSDEAAYEAMETVGRSIGETVLSAVADAREADPLSGPLSVSRREFSLEKRNLRPRSELEALYADLTAEIEAHGGDDVAPEFQELSGDDPRKAPLLERWYVEEDLRLHDVDWESYDSTATLVELDDLGVLALPAEVHAEDGLQFKAAADVPSLVVAGYADDYLSYLPPDVAFENGGYEVRTCKFSPEAVRRFRATVLDLLA